jgi:hypothetical protein
MQSQGGVGQLREVHEASFGVKGTEAS